MCKVPSTEPKAKVIFDGNGDDVDIDRGGGDIHKMVVMMVVVMTMMGVMVVMMLVTMVVMMIVVVIISDH